MSRPLRIEFSGAIYHLMARGNGRHDIVCDDGDRQRLTDGFEATVEHYGLSDESLRQRGRHTEMRSVVAWLAKRHPQVTLWELTEPLGLGRPQSVGNLTRRIDLALSKSKKLRRTIEEIEAEIADCLAKESKRTRGKKKK